MQCGHFNTNAVVAPGGAGGVNTVVKVHPTYSGCTAFTFLSATVDTTNCNYEGSGVNSINANEWNAKLTVNCSGNTVITINAGSGTCVATVDDQTINSGIVIGNTGNSPMDFDVTATATPVAVNRVADGFGCDFKATGPTTGDYTGTTEMICKNAANTIIGCTITNML